MTLEQTRQAIIDAAQSWIGTPFYPHQAVKGVGADCVHLALAIYQDAGIVPKDVELPKEYRMAGGDHLDQSLVLKWLETCGYVEPDSGPNIGDVITLRVGRVDHHVGVVIGETKFIQSIRNYGVIICDLRDSTWQKRLRTFWKPKVCSETAKQ